MNIFFYIMVFSHNGKVGFGLTKSVNKRIFDYISHSAELQSFKYLYYGPKDTIIEIEKKLKKEWKRYMWTIYKGNKWSLEILDPDYKKSSEDVQAWLEDQIIKFDLPIRKVKADWLPYKGDKLLVRKNIDLNPEMFLET